MTADLTGKTVVLGLDGATWDLLEPLARRGVMPNLARGLERGRRARLASCLPPYSAPAWTSIATGTNPGKHGIFDFWEETAPGERRPVSAGTAHGAKLWDLASAAGRRVQVVNVPVTYPPAAVNGSFVSGMMTPGEAVPYTHPAELKAELKALPGGYEADPYAAGLAGRAFVQQAQHWIRQKEAAVQHLMATREWDLLFSVIQAPDPLQHKFWNLLDERDPRHDRERAAALRDDLDEAYRRCDEVIGARLQLAERGALVLILSDHGFGRYEKLFYINRVLEDAGLLVRRRAGAARSRISARRLIRGARRLDVLRLESRLPTAARQRLARGLDRAIASPVDWEKTRAYAASGSAESVFVRAQAGERDEICRRVIEALEAARDPESGERIVEAAHRREDVYSGPHLERLPDIVIDFGERPYLASDRLAVPALTEPLAAADGGGRHRRHGILLAAGPGVAPGEIERAEITDICPTVLHSLRLPVPSDVDGRVLTELFSDGRPVERSEAGAASGAAAAQYSAEEEEAIEASLRNIGYL